MTTSTNYTGISYIEEVTAGTTPPTPAFQILPTTGGSPVSNISTAVSEVIRSDRQTDDLVIVDAEVSGDLSYELSYAPYKPLIEALMQNDTSRAIALTGVTADGSASKFTAAGIETTVLVGDIFKGTSVADPTIDQSYVCTASAAGEITVYPNVPAGATATDVALDANTIISNGANTPKSYTFMKKATNNNVPYYWYYTGCQINSLSFDFATGSILNGSLGIMGLVEEATETAKTGQTEVDVQDYTIMNAVSSIATISIEGVNLGKCSFSNFGLSVNNNINAAKSIGILGACALAAFSIEVTADTEVYFENLDLYEKFLAAESFAVSLILIDGEGNTIGISLPKCKFETLDTPIDGKDNFLMQTGTLRALRDATLDYMIKFSFTDA